MKKLTYLLSCFFIPLCMQAQSNAEGSSSIENDLSALVSYNFTGSNGSVSNLTPEIFFGWTRTVLGKEETSPVKYEIKVGPYTSTQIKIEDSSAYLPALLMPGNAGIVFNNFIVIGAKKDHLVISPLSMGFKVMSNFTDSTRALTQHNLRFGIGYQHDELVSVSFQFTYGWHNLTSVSEENFKKTFGEKNTDFQAVNVTIQTRVSKEEQKDPLYLFASWRACLNAQDLGDLPNNRILSIGIRKSLNVRDGMQAAK